MGTGHTHPSPGMASQGTPRREPWRDCVRRVVEAWLRRQGGDRSKQLRRLRDWLCLGAKLGGVLGRMLEDLCDRGVGGAFGRDNLRVALAWLPRDDRSLMEAVMTGASPGSASPARREMALLKKRCAPGGTLANVALSIVVRTLLLLEWEWRVRDWITGGRPCGQSLVLVLLGAVDSWSIPVRGREGLEMGARAVLLGEANWRLFVDACVVCHALGYYNMDKASPDGGHLVLKALYESARTQLWSHGDPCRNLGRDELQRALCMWSPSSDGVRRAKERLCGDVFRMRVVIPRELGTGVVGGGALGALDKFIASAPS